MQLETFGACLFSVFTASCLWSFIFWRELHQSGNGGCPWERMARLEREHSNRCGSKSKDGEDWWEEMPSTQGNNCASPGMLGKVHSWTRVRFNPIWNALSMGVFIKLTKAKNIFFVLSTYITHLWNLQI